MSSASPEKITIAGPQCSAPLAVPVSAMGKQARCPQCQRVFPLAAPAAPAPTSNGIPAAGLGSLSPPPLRSTSAPANQFAPAPPNQPAPFSSPAAGNNPFADASQGDYQLQPNPYQPPASAASLPASTHYPPPPPAQQGSSGSMLSGIGMMVGAVVWFVVGWACGRIFFYPPILFIIGLVTFFRGMMNGNVAGNR